MAWQKAFGIEPATMGIALTVLTNLSFIQVINKIPRYESCRKTEDSYRGIFLCTKEFYFL